MSLRQARAWDIFTSTASVYVEKLKQLGATYQHVCGMHEDVLLPLLFPGEGKAPRRPLPDFDYLNKELSGNQVTLQLLHEDHNCRDTGVQSVEELTTGI